MSKYHTLISEYVKYLPANTHLNKNVCENWLMEEDEVTKVKLAINHASQRGKEAVPSRGIKSETRY